jgi:hypothetical protein
LSVARAFTDQAEACAGLGSDFTARLLRTVADLLGEDGPVTARLRSWTGDASSAGQSVPLRLAGGLHALVLTGRDPDLTTLYPPSPMPDPANLRALVARAMVREADFLLDWLDSPPQTNETGRAAVLLPAASHIASRFGLPFDLVELGASAGLNLRFDRFRLETPAGPLGLPGSPLVLTPDWRGDAPKIQPIRVRSRLGVDINPLDPTRTGDALRLQSYIWPDQPTRLSRMRAALSIAAEVPAIVAREDAAAFLARTLPKRQAGAVTLIYHTIAWQYFPPETQSLAEEVIERAGTSATTDAPLACLGMEADDLSEGAGVTLRLWPGGKVIDLGRADFHGRWIDWRQPPG